MNIEIDFKALMLANGIVVEIEELYEYIDDLLHNHLDEIYLAGDNETLHKFHCHLDNVLNDGALRLKYAKFDCEYNYSQWLEAVRRTNVHMATKSQFYAFIASSCKEQVKTGTKTWTQAFNNSIKTLGNRWLRNGLFEVGDDYHYFFSDGDAFAFGKYSIAAPSILISDPLP